MWAADGRLGGAPDPTTAGPPFIQIGTEGGLLPAPVVIPSMPTGYEANTRSVTITNVSVDGLWLGPAERADVIVDFSKFAGKTLILYNDAPTPAPAVDSRLDYFTGDGDQTPIGGAPNTLPGYGPNTRTIMQIVVGTGAPTNAFSLPALTKVLPSLFAQTQPVPIVPEPTYPPASGGYSAIPTYSQITDASLTFYPIGSTTPVTYTDERKTIQELFTLDYGRMNATLGVELPLTNFLTQTTIPLGYIDPVTEVIDQGATATLAHHPQWRGHPLHPLPPVQRAGDQPLGMGRHQEAARPKRIGLEGHRPDEPVGRHPGGVETHPADAALPGSRQLPAHGRDDASGSILPGPRESEHQFTNPGPVLDFHT